MGVISAMGVIARGLAPLLAAAALAGSPVQFLQARESGGAFAETGSQPDAALTAWAALGLVAAHAGAPGSLAYLRTQEPGLASVADVALVAVAERALGGDPSTLLQRLRAAERPSGQIGPTVNSTVWAVLALDASPPATTRWLLARQARSGGFSWAAGVEPDSNDTAAALEALRVAGVHGKPVARAVTFLLRFEDADGGFALEQGRGSDAQSTAWAIQGLLAAGRTPPRRAFRYLAGLRRPDGSFRYSAQYVTTPVWVTSQVLAALARRPFPLTG